MEEHDIDALIDMAYGNDYVNGLPVDSDE